MNRSVLAISLVVLGLPAAVIAGEQAASKSPTLPARAMAEISAERIRTNIEKLTAFRTRHTLSPARNPVRGIGAAQTWLLRQFHDSNTLGDGKEGFLKCWTEAWREPTMDLLPEGAELTNVMAGLRGTMPLAQDNFCVVVAHFDTRNSDVYDSEGDAPGANDNASGVAAVLEIARALADKPLDATIVFLLSSGGEQGSLGAKYRVEQLAAQHQYITAVLNLDTIGDPALPGSNQASVGTEASRAVRVFSPGLDRSGGSAQREARVRSRAENDSPSRQLARYIVEVAETERSPARPALTAGPDADLPAGDYRAFLDVGYPAVRLSQPHEDESRPRENDTPDAVDPAYVADIARLNAAVLVHLCNAPMTPRNARLITSDHDPSAPHHSAVLRWDANTETDFAGYELVWRDATAPNWQHSKDLGVVTETRIEPASHSTLFGVRAYDKHGYKSIVVFPTVASE